MHEYYNFVREDTIPFSLAHTSLSLRCPPPGYPGEGVRTHPQKGRRTHGQTTRLTLFSEAQETLRTCIGLPASHVLPTRDRPRPAGRP